MRKLGIGRFSNWKSAYSRGLSRGILVFWDDRVLVLLEVEMSVHSFSCRFKNCDENFIWVFSGVYRLVGNVDKEELWAELGDIKGLWSDLWCIGGDFNVVRFPRERRKNSRIPFAMKCFLEVIEELHLRDLPLARGCFTWCGDPNSRSLSRSHFNGLSQKLLPRPTSNLAPILLDGGRIKSGKSPFHFENMWLRVEGFKDLVKSWWTGYTFSGSFSHILACKLKMLK